MPGRSARRCWFRSQYLRPIDNDLVVYNFSNHVVLVQESSIKNDYTTNYKSISVRRTLGTLPAHGHAEADRYVDRIAREGETVCLVSYQGHLDYEYIVTDGRTQVIFVTAFPRPFTAAYWLRSLDCHCLSVTVQFPFADLSLGLSSAFRRSSS